MPGKASIKRDVYPEEDRLWHILKYGQTKLRIVKRARYDSTREPGNRNYIEYIVTDKPDDQINWETTDET